MGINVLNNVGFYNLNKVSFKASNNAPVFAPSFVQNQTAPMAVSSKNVPGLNNINTQLTNRTDIQMYNEILNAFATSEAEKTSPQDKVLRQNKLDTLLKNGTLLNNSSNDGSTVLKNLYDVITTKRAGDMSGLKIAGQIIDTIYDPAVITQKFGDIPKKAKTFILDNNKNLTEKDINVEASGTCVAASVEFHMANKLPAEFARWASSLTSPNVEVDQNINLSALSKNKMDAIWLLKEFETNVAHFGFNDANLKIKPDENAIVRAQIQDNYWDKGERSILDVLFQSTLMQLGSQNSYNSLTDTISSKFSQNTSGLIEFEKTYIESLVDNSERSSVIYQNLDAEQNIIGWNCTFEDIQNHIIKAIDAGEDVIVGCVSTAAECNEPNVNPNKVVNGHEMTIVGYKQDAQGNLIFICNDTDDDKSELVEYQAGEFIPKIHHASYLAKIVEEMNINQ